MHPFYADPLKTFMYNITGVPEMFIINGNGEVIRFLMIPLTEARLAAELDAVLQARS